ncbi:unnamed protein product [Anisakis simplex]|uniref:Uncharacterized protein n=1 Tax=Anisakis simplex TaxID=6269 RepID=A0A0M3JLA5_ANISI|nr:unnamed protein product [Anisakis simplex]
MVVHVVSDASGDEDDENRKQQSSENMELDLQDIAHCDHLSVGHSSPPTSSEELSQQSSSAADVVALTSRIPSGTRSESPTTSASVTKVCSSPLIHIINNVLCAESNVNTIT